KTAQRRNLCSFHSSLAPEQPPESFAASCVACWVCVLSCLLLACCYVGSLYVWKGNLPRDHPSVIKRRCVSVLLVAALSPAAVKTWTHWVDVSVLELMGVRMKGLLPALILPLLLTVETFTSVPPYNVIMRFIFPDGGSWRLCVRDAVWLRNQVVAPLTEELVFRGAMLPMLVPCTGPTAAIFTAPLLFGVETSALAHTVEIQNDFRQVSLNTGANSTEAFFLYTSVFGAFTSFIFMRTGHVAGPVLCHSFCNSRGLPDIGAALQHPQHSLLLFLYVLGVVMFLVLLFPLTDPFFYGAIPVCSLAPPSASVC
uniref:CAAX prenyl protease 2 n=1 Tax=Salarias fasciatus TaxID=181472 RepID=A0A672FSC2_SALFA